MPGICRHRDENTSPCGDAPSNHRRLGNGGREFDDQPGIERLGNDLVGAEAAAARFAEGAGHHFRGLLAGKIGKRPHAGDLHLVVDGAGTDIERAAEAGEAPFLARLLKEGTNLLVDCVVPSFTSFLIRTLAWRIPLAPNGAFSGWLESVGLVGDKGLQLLLTSTAVQIAIVYNYLGFMILPLFVALDRIEPGVREASKDLGANRTSTFVSVTLPLAGPGIAAGVHYALAGAAGEMIVAQRFSRSK